MKKIINSEDRFILFFINLFDIDEDKLKEIFMKLKKFYNINIFGFYNIEAYIDKFYGTILKVYKDNELDLFYKQIDMHIVIDRDKSFLYKVNDFFFIKKLSNFNIYYYDNSFYLEIIKKITNKEMYNLIENSEMIFEGIDTIKNKGKLL